MKEYTGTFSIIVPWFSDTILEGWNIYIPSMSFEEYQKRAQKLDPISKWWLDA